MTIDSSHFVGIAPDLVFYEPLACTVRDTRHQAGGPWISAAAMRRAQHALKLPPGEGWALMHLNPDDL